MLRVVKSLADGGSLVSRNRHRGGLWLLILQGILDFRFEWLLGAHSACPQRGSRQSVASC